MIKSFQDIKSQDYWGNQEAIMLEDENIINSYDLKYNLLYDQINEEKKLFFYQMKKIILNFLFLMNFNYSLKKFLHSIPI